MINIALRYLLKDLPILALLRQFSKLKGKIIEEKHRHQDVFSIKRPKTQIARLILNLQRTYHSIAKAAIPPSPAKRILPLLVSAKKLLAC